MLKSVTFRFYEELNDFLPGGKRKVPFVHSFEGNSSVKDVIEALGVPHVEVDLILINGIPVSFSHIPQNGDVISVYPVFETLEISGVSPLREKPLRETKFVLDVHLGKLAKYLRMLGFDTVYRNDYDDREIARIGQIEKRIILTRDIGLLKIKSVTHGYFIRDQKPKKQLTEVLQRFDLYKSIDPFSRCIKCNGPISLVEKDRIDQFLEPLTRKYYNRFYQCLHCENIYWEGSHFNRINHFIADIRNSAET